MRVGIPAARSDVWLRRPTTMERRSGRPAAAFGRANRRLPQRRQGLRSASCCSGGGNASSELFFAGASNHAAETPIAGRTVSAAKSPLIRNGTSSARKPVEAGADFIVKSSRFRRRSNCPPPIKVASLVWSLRGEIVPNPLRRSMMPSKHFTNRWATSDKRPGMCTKTDRI